MARSALAAAVSVLRLINFRAIRRHTLRALLASLSLGGGVAIVVAVMIETSSVSAAIDDVGYRIAGPAPLRIVGAATQGGIGPAVMAAAQDVSGVSVLAPVVRAATQVRDGGRDTVVLALGIDCSARWMIDPKVCGAGQKEPQVMATSTTFGRSLGKSRDVGDRPRSAADIWTSPDPAAGHRQQRPRHRVAAQRGQGAVRPRRPGRHRLRTLADQANATAVQARIVEALDVLGPGYRVLTRNDPAAGFNVNVVLFPLLAIFALIAVGVGVILISQLTRLSIQERRREVAIASALGASPLSTLVGFLAEAALLGAAGSVIGVLLGAIIARPVVASASDLTQQFVGVNVPVVVEPSVVVAGLAIGVLLALLAAIVPSLSASKTPIATELSGRAAYEDTKSARVWQKAAALLATGFAAVFLVWSATLSGGLEPWQAAIANGAVVVAIVGLLLAAAYFSAQILASIRLQPDRAHSAVLAIAFTGLRTDQTRTTAIAGAVAVPVAIATLLSGFLVAIDRGVENVAQAQATDRLVVTTTRFTDWGSIGCEILARQHGEACRAAGGRRPRTNGGNRDHPRQRIAGLRASRGSANLLVSGFRRAVPERQRGGEPTRGRRNSGPRQRYSRRRHHPAGQWTQRPQNPRRNHRGHSRSGRAPNPDVLPAGRADLWSAAARFGFHQADSRCQTSTHRRRDEAAPSISR